MSLKDAFIVKEAGPFRVIPGGKPAHEPSDPQGSLYPAEDGQTDKEQLQASVKYVIAKLKEFEEKIEQASDEQLYSIALDMTDVQSDLLWALKKVLEKE
jgi:hypothetical protein